MSKRAVLPAQRHHGLPVPMTVWSHEAKPGLDDIIIDMSLLPHAKVGDVAEMQAENSKHRAIRFIVKPLTPERKKSMTNVQISVLSPILSALDIPPRSRVQVRTVNKEDAHADLVEVYFKDMYLTRADMWRISTSLIGQCLYANQRISYCEIVRASIKTVYRHGKKIFSGYIGPDTKIVYRSEAARMIYFIQMSAEMWNFVENGELMFHKLVNSFLPEVFRRWREQGAHHLVSIVLFTSVDISKRKTRLGQGERETATRDYFHIVIDQMNIGNWNEIMAKLRYEFARFMREVLLQADGEIAGRILPAVKGNMIEAISFATSLISSKFLDRDLRRAAIQVIIVSPGTGIYDVDYELFYQTSMKLLSIEIGIDILCLSRPPLHVTPLFRYKDPRTQQIVNCVPSWLDISFWNSTDRRYGNSSVNQWIPRCKIYDIQMMGIMENEINAIRLDYLPNPTSNSRQALDQFMREYDDNTVFLSRAAIASQRLIEEATSTNSTSTLLRPRVSAVEMGRATTTTVTTTTADGTSGTNNNASTPKTGTVAHANVGPRNVWVATGVPTTAIISTPSESKSTALLTNAIKGRNRISALTSLLSLGMRGDSQPSTATTAKTAYPSFSSPSREHKAPPAPRNNLIDRSASQPAISQANVAGITARSPSASMATISIQPTPSQQPTASTATTSIPSREVSESVEILSERPSQKPNFLERFGASFNQRVPNFPDRFTGVMAGGASEYGRSPPGAVPQRRPGMAGRQGSFTKLKTMSTGSPESSSGTSPRHNRTLTSTSGSGGGTASLGVGISLNPNAHETEEGNHIWYKILNPSNVDPRSVPNITNFGRWRNVFPKGIKRRSVKWRSLKAPAALPLSTDIFPRPEEFARNFTLQNYDIALDAEKEDYMTPGDLIEEMVALRLHIGFQIVIGDRVAMVEAQQRPDGNPKMIVPTVPQDYKGIRVYMTRRNQIHRLAVDQYDTINVQLYTRNEEVDAHGNTNAGGSEHGPSPLASYVGKGYHPLVKTRFDTSYHLAPGNFFDPSVRIVNWNRLDQQLAGYSDFFQESDKLFRIRLVLLPVDPGNKALGMYEGQDKLTFEELRLEGLRKIMATIYKGRYLTPQEKRLRGNRKKEDTPPDIKFYTGDLGSFLMQLYEDYSETTNADNSAGTRKGSFLIRESERLNKSIRLKQLAGEIQSERGIQIADRRWHWKTHVDCFVGHELVNWLIDTFTDIDTREEAVEYGNQMMEMGLFRHVDDRHSFMDGHYYYRIASEYKEEPAVTLSATSSPTHGPAQGPIASSSQPQPSNSSASSGGGSGARSFVRGLRKSRSSNLSAISGIASNNTQVTQGSNSQKGGSGIHSTGQNSGQNSTQPNMEDGTSSLKSGAEERSERSTRRQDSSKPMPRLFISQEIIYDIDSGRRSKRHEVLTMHVDRVHNPENAFHLRVEWLNATPKLIDDALVNIGRIGDRYGLKMVQMPIEEISTLPNDSPFCCLMRAVFALNPLAFHKERTALATAVQRHDSATGTVRSIGSIDSSSSAATVLPPHEASSGPELAASRTSSSSISLASLPDDPLVYHKEFLKRHGFIMDVVPASSLMNDEIEIQYSWGKPFYNYGQYIHTSGTIIAQIVGDENRNQFVFMVNALQVNRVSVSMGSMSQQPAVDPDELLKSLKTDIEDSEYLEQFFDEVMEGLSKQTSASVGAAHAPPSDSTEMQS